MKIRMGKWLGITALVLTVAAALCAFILLQPNRSGPKDVEETRRTLRQQGFKTDLAEFNFSTTAELRAREAAITSVSAAPSPPLFNQPDLMAVTDDSAIVVWKQDWLPADSEDLHWQDLHDSLDPIQPQLDAACDAVLSGPIRFNLEAARGSAMLLRSLAPLKGLTQLLGNRAVLELHEGFTGSAWKNVLASTRLVTAWEPEAVDISHLVRFACVPFAYRATWQALQTNCWSEDQLAGLQHEWESADFFKGLPEAAAFKRASVVDLCERERQEPPLGSGVTAGDLFKEAFRSPRSVGGMVTLYWKTLRYRNQGTYEDEKALLLFYRDRELELRQAIHSPTWAEMRALPGVTNATPFVSKYSSRMQSLLNMRELSVGFQRQGAAFLGRASQAEAQRRILITAIALERHLAKHGAYPKTLAELVPEFLKTPPVDFMDGQPLRYRLTDDGHFVLYSVGLDCLDDHGKIVSKESRRAGPRMATGFGVAREADLVWPRPAPVIPPAIRKLTGE